MNSVEKKIIAAKVKLADAVITLRNLQRLAAQAQQEDADAIAELTRLERQQEIARRQLPKMVSGNGRS